MIEVKYRLKELRNEKQLQQQEVADILRVSKQVYNRYENEKRTIPIEILWELADFYNVTVDYLIDRSEF